VTRGFFDRFGIFIEDSRVVRAILSGLKIGFEAHFWQATGLKKLTTIDRLGVLLYFGTVRGISIAPPSLAILKKGRSHFF
jgi:hypothetical protein